MTLNILLFGAPGSGKGTQAKILETNYNICHISTGDLLRKRIAVGDAFALEIQEKVKITGDAESDRLMAAMVEERIAQPDCKKGFVLDGFPRTVGQAHAFQDMLQRNKKSVTAAIVLTADAQTLIERITGRYSCEDCGASYHDTLRPSLQANCCDLCHSGKMIRRSYDTADVMLERLRDYQQITIPVFSIYKSQNTLYELDAVREPTQVAQDIAQVVNSSPFCP